MNFSTVRGTLVPRTVLRLSGRDYRSGTDRVSTLGYFILHTLIPYLLTSPLVGPSVSSHYKCKISSPTVRYRTPGLGGVSEKIYRGFVSVRERT